MQINTIKSNLYVKAVLPLLFIFLTFSSGHLGFTGANVSAQAKVLLDSHSNANGLSAWTITTSHPNELIIISAGGYSFGGSLSTSPGTVTVNGNNATFITVGRWLSGQSWQECIWAYVAPIAGTYSCACTEVGLSPTYYINFASSVYQPNCPLGLGLNNIVVGGSDSNHGPSTITASITTTENYSLIYGSVDNNDNGGSGTVAWNGQLTESDHMYSIGDGVDGAQADSTYAVAGTYTITSTDIGASNIWMTIALIAVEPNASCCSLTATANALSNVSCNGEDNGSAIGIPGAGHTPYTYSWVPGGQTTATVTGLSAGVYNVIISDTVGCSVTAEVTITQPTVLTSNPVPTNVRCKGGEGSIDAGVAGGTSPYTYLWTPGNTTSGIATGLSAGCYTVSVTDARGCTATATACITQPATAPSVTITGNQTICVGTLGTLTANATGGSSPYTYLWVGNASTSSTATIPAISKTDTVKITDANGCTASAKLTITAVPRPVPVVTPKSDSVCQGDTVTLTGSGGITYRWSNGKTTSIIKVVPQITTTYTMATSNGACSDSIAVTVKITPKIGAVSSIIDSIVCPYDSSYLTITASGGPATYKWSTGATTSSIGVTDTVTTTYTATAYGICDSVQKFIKVTVIPLPKPAISGNTWACKGTRPVLTVSSSNSPTTYRWSNGKTTTSITTGPINGDSTVYVVATNSLGCSVTDTFHIAERLYPTGNVTYPPACGSNETTITAMAGGTGPFTYQWSTGSTNDSITVTIISDTTTYTVTISNGCLITKTVEVIQDVPLLSACCDAVIYTGGDTTISAGGTNIVKYRWTPDNGSLNCDTCATVIASPETTTTYTVIGTDATGCTSERTVTITVDIPCFNFIVPNVFTPTSAGALGLDNLFYINTKNIDAWSINIFDRWGKEVYKSANPNQYWDGSTMGGSNAAEGVYYYVINATCQGTTFKKDGFVQLIR